MRFFLGSEERGEGDSGEEDGEGDADDEAGTRVEA